ncbi:MAG TPA: LTA synthase family protein [Nitrospira sp.]|nr:LTA synthase family protein [Nitrospira sp.]
MSDWSVKQRIVFWWVLFLVIQQVERWVLLPDVINAETPALGLLVQTFTTGFRADLITSTIVILVSVLAAGLVSLVLWPLTGRRREDTLSESYSRSLTVAGSVVGLLLMVLLLLDIGYYRFNQQRLNFVFFEYLGDLITQWKETGFIGSQAAGQTGAELEDRGKWAGPVLGFLFCESVAILVWYRGYARLLRALSSRLAHGTVLVPNLLLLLALAIGLTGFHHRGPEAIRAADISSAAYYTLAQNPVLYAGEGLRAALDAQWTSDQRQMFDQMPLTEAIRATQAVVDREAIFPYPDYPLVHRTANPGLPLARPANVLIIFVEALDRRYLNKTVGGIRVTPFLDHLRNDSVYFEHFFSNGVQTARGLFSTLCSYYPRQGTAAMKTHYLHDYACLPSLLRERGYRTEMVVGYDRDLNRLHVFLSRNGLHELFDRTSFPPSVEEIGAFAGIGRPDGALLDLVRTRVETLRAAGSPYCLMAMTIGTHHPFAVPASATHPDIQGLRSDSDSYLSALRYVDLELERVLTAMKRDGLLKDTVVLILGDHGRHEKVGQTDFERQAGHFMTPLFIWIDDSLRTAHTYQPRTVTTVASQVDLLPTILALNGAAPRLSASLGRDLSCLLRSDCMQDNVAFLSSVYDDLIGLADGDGLLLYSLRSQTVRRSDLDLNEPAVVLDAANPAIAHRYRRLLALYVASNTVLNQNKIWSWKEFGSKL